MSFQNRKFKPDDNRSEDTEIYSQDDRAILCAEMLRRFANNPNYIFNTKSRKESARRVASVQERLRREAGMA